VGCVFVYERARVWVESVVGDYGWGCMWECICGWVCECDGVCVGGGVGSVWVCIVYVWVEVGVGAKLHKYVCLGLFVFSRLCLLMCNVHMLT
jgi:hypothetical protein